MSLSRSINQSGGDDDWIWVDEGAMKGFNIMVDRSSGDVISLSSRQCRDFERWKDKMPSVAEYAKTLQVLDLDNCRYVIELNDSIGSLQRLQSLYLTRCERLERLPASLCCLSNLEEVSSYIAYEKIVDSSDSLFFSSACSYGLPSYCEPSGTDRELEKVG